MPRSTALVAVVILLVAACSQATTSGLPNGNVPQPHPTVNPSDLLATPTPFVQPSGVVTASAAPSVEPSSEPASGQADVKVVRQVFKKWQDKGSPYITVDVMIQVENDGSGWADLDASQGDFTLYASDGSVTETGDFLYNYPEFLAPGATGYYLDDAVFDDTKLADLVKLDSDTYFDQIDNPDPQLATSKLTIKTGEFDEGFNATGIVRNLSTTTDVSGAVVGCVYSDGNGVPLAFSYTNLVKNLKAGQSKGFATVGGSAPVARSSIKKVACFASSTDF